MESRSGHTETGTGEVARMAWTGAPANYDCRANDPTGNKRPVRRVVRGGAGTIVYTGVDGTNVTYPATMPAVLDVQIAALVNTSTATDVMVVW